MYKAYYCPTASEYFFQLRPKKSDLEKVLIDSGDDEMDWKKFEITKIKVIKNYPED